MKEALFCFYFFLLYLSPLSALTLNDAIQMAINENPEIKSGEETVQSSKYDVRSSYGKLLPQINLEGRHTHLNEAITLDASDMRNAIVLTNTATFATAVPSAPPTAIGAFKSTLENRLPASRFQMQVQKRDFNNLSASLVWPLYTGGKIWANIHAKEEEHLVSQSYSNGIRDRIVSDVVINYMRVQFLKDLLSIRGEVVKGLETHLAEAQKILKQGLISKANKMRVDVALAMAKKDFIKTESDLDLAYTLLRNSLGASHIKNEKEELLTPLYMVKEIPNLDEALKEGENANINLQILKHRENQLDAKVSSTTAEFLPNLFLFGKYELYKHDLTLMEPEWAVGVGVKMNIFDGGQDLANVQAARAQRSSVGYIAQNAKELIRTEIQKYHHDLIASKAQFDALESSKELSVENLRLNRLSFVQGMMTSLEVIDAELALGKVKMEQKQALFDSNVALILFLRSIGKTDRFVDYANANTNTNTNTNKTI